MSLPGKNYLIRTYLLGLLGFFCLGTGIIHASTLPAEPLSPRVITLAPHITELVFAAGAGAHIVATVQSSNAPPPARDLPRVGDGIHVNAEQLLAYKPDIVIAWQNTLAMQKLAPLLKQFNVELLFSAPQSLDDVVSEIARFQKRLNPQATRALNQPLQDQLIALRQRYATQPSVSVYIEVGTHPLYTLGADPLMNHVLQTCGAENSFAHSVAVAPTISVESVLQHNPDLIIIASKQAQTLSERKQYWQQLGAQAARRGHIALLDPDTLLRPGPRLVAATERLCAYIDAVRHKQPIFPL